MTHAEYTVLVTDEDLVILGDPITDWITLDVTLRFNEPGSGLVELPGRENLREQLVPGCRIVVIRYTHETGGEILLSGPMEQFLHERSDNGENAGIGRITVHFGDDLAKVVARQTYPNPAQTPDTQTTEAWTYTGNAELALRDLVNLNAGPGALVARRVPQLALGTLASVGTSVTVTADRMQPLGEVAREIAQVGGELGFRTRQSGGQILFEVYDPPDVSTTARFGFNLGNLKYIGYELSAPKATTVIAGGQGDVGEPSRALVERNNTVDEAAWGRYETLHSTSGEDTAKAEDEADLKLAEAAPTIRIATSIADNEQQQYGVHYGLGSKVAIEVATGVEIVDVVRTVHIQAWATAGSIISATVGSQAANTAPSWASKITTLEERLGRLERRVVPAAT